MSEVVIAAKALGGFAGRDGSGQADPLALLVVLIAAVMIIAVAYALRSARPRAPRPARTALSSSSC